MTLRLTPARFALSYIALGVIALALLAVPLWYGFQANLGTFRSYIPAAEMQRFVDIFHRDGPRRLAAAVDAYARPAVATRSSSSSTRRSSAWPETCRAWPAEVPDVPGTYGLVIEPGGDAPTRVVVSHVTLAGRLRPADGPRKRDLRFAGRALLVRHRRRDGRRALAGCGLGWLLRRSLLAGCAHRPHRRRPSWTATWRGGCRSRRLERARPLAQTVNEHARAARRRARLTRARTGSGTGTSPTDEFYASPRLLEIYGLPPGTTFAGRKRLPRPLPVPSGGPRAKWERAARRTSPADGAGFDIEVRMLRGGERAGSISPAWRRATPRAESRAGPARRRDITERKRAEEACGCRRSATRARWKVRTRGTGTGTS